MRSSRMAALAFVCVPLAMLWGWSAFLLQPTTARADEGDDSGYVVANPTIDCSVSNPGFRNQDNIATLKEVGGPINIGQNCQSCHRNEHPQMGQGDKPSLTQATALVQNRTDRSISYQARFATQENWKDITLKPGQVYHHTWLYGKTVQKGRGRSPELLVKYDSDPLNKTRHLIPMATPNKNLGAVYFFDTGEDQQMRIYEPGVSIARRR